MRTIAAIAGAVATRRRTEVERRSTAALWRRVTGYDPVCGSGAERDALWNAAAAELLARAMNAGMPRPLRRVFDAVRAGAITDDEALAFVRARRSLQRALRVTERCDNTIRIAMTRQPLLSIHALRTWWRRLGDDEAALPFQLRLIMHTVRFDDIPSLGCEETAFLSMDDTLASEHEGAFDVDQYLSRFWVKVGLQRYEASEPERERLLAEAATATDSNTTRGDGTHDDEKGRNVR